MPPDITSTQPQAFARVERLARWLDDAFPIPFTRWRIGLDAIIGLIPGVGDVAGLAIGSYLIWEAHRLGAPGHLKWKMARNVGVDAVAGLVPVLGDVVDMAYRSNRRNMDLLRGHFKPAEVAHKERRQQWLRWLLRIAVVGGIAAAIWRWRHPGALLHW